MNLELFTLTLLVSFLLSACPPARTRTGLVVILVQTTEQAPGRCNVGGLHLQLA